ncbi:hypothetical protein ACA910_003985 [Epithemia clementina (nom. ined.)]
MEQKGSATSHPSIMTWILAQQESGVRESVSKGILDPVVKGPTCPRPSPEQDVQWRKVTKSELDLRHQLPSVFSRCGFVRRRLTDKEVGGVLDFPLEIAKGNLSRSLKQWVEARPVPFKIRLEVIRRLRLWSAQGYRFTCLRQTETPFEIEGDTHVAYARTELTTSTELISGNSAKKWEPHVKVTKSDDAEIPFVLWDNRVLDGLQGRVLSPDEFSNFANRMRQWLHRLWVQKVTRGFWPWWQADVQQLVSVGRKPHEPSLRAGISAIQHAQKSTWWDWDNGSSPFFWRFPSDWLEDMRDGLKPMWIASPRKYTRRQQNPLDPQTREKEKAKLSKVRQRGYITPLENIKSLTNFFSVPKGDADIRMVYDGTKSGLNAALFAPWFSLATVDTMLRSVDQNTWSADNDFGEMFLNFWLHPELRKYAGIDLTGLFPEELEKGAQSGATSKPRKTIWEAWLQCAMGLTTSPYQATQSAQRVKRLSLGNRLNPHNVFRWDGEVLNLPGDANYDPSLSWVRRVCQDGVLAADVHPYVDDLRETDPSEAEAWEAASCMAKAAAYYGLQDAARKRRPPSQTPGAWAGALIASKTGGVYIMVSQELWQKLKGHVENLRKCACQSSIDRKALEQTRGFLVYITLTYGVMTPYLKGLHLILESWRLDRDEDGWRMTPMEFATFIHEHRHEWTGNCHEGKSEEQATPPCQVAPVPRLKGDIEALSQLTEAENPPRVLVRLRQTAIAAMMFGAASGAGFGTSL